MGAPTWPPTPEDAHKATLEEYGDQARAVLDFDDEDEAEAALLAPFLFGPAQRELVQGEAHGQLLDPLRRSLSAWLRMLGDRGPGHTFELGDSDPASTDGVDLYLPRALPAPLAPAEDALLYRCLALVQLGLQQFGFLAHRSQLTELHTDWVLRSVWHLLAVRSVVHQWSEGWPGVAADFRALRFVEKAAILRVNLTVVPRRGMPSSFLPLYAGLTDFVEQDEHPDGDAARAAAAAVTALTGPGAPLVVMGQAQRLRLLFRQRRLGPPPLPYFAGILRPEWLLHDLAADLQAFDAWREGPKPLQILKQALARKERPGRRIPRSIRGLMKAGGGSAPPPVAELEHPGTVPRPGSEDGRRHDEWDAGRSVYKVGFTRVIEAPAPGGPLAHYDRIVAANQAQIAEIRRRFEALRLEERWLHGQPDGTEIDLNRAVAAMADVAAGYTPRVDWYKRFQRQRQDVAILTLVDTSGSTQGRIIHLEQEAIVLFAEGLATLGFPHAFATFSNHGPQDCRYGVIADWDDTLADDAVRKRMGNLQAGGATRLGAFIRHATWRLAQRPEGRRVLILLSDGRPHDTGDYRDGAAVADAAMAALEARRQGVFVFCISLDTQPQAEDYLRRIFSPGRFLVLDRVDALPSRLPEVFRALVR